MNKLLKRLKLNNLSDLALLMPKKFSNYAIAKEPVFEQKQAAILQINAIRNSHAGKRLVCECFCEHWGMVIMCVFFYPAAAIRRAFVVGKSVHVYGKLSTYSGLAQFSNPEIVPPNAQIDCDFRIRAVSNEEIFAAKAKYLDEKFYYQSGLPEQIYSILLAMNEPSAQASALFGSKKLTSALKYTEIFYFLKRLHERAAASPVRTILKPHDISSWLAALPFTPTADQLAAIADIRSDLSRARHKERIVMGDVGCGKSLVMFAAALLAYPQRSVIMAPTSVLAAQLAAEARRLLPEYFQVFLLQSQAKRAKEHKSSSELKNSLLDAHLIISTHAALHADLGEIALVMIDEQQRFSTRQRSNLGAQNGAHYVEFSATPIPRTTAMINSGLFSYSFIKQIPYKKQINTIMLPVSQAAKVFAKMHEEIAKNHQAIVIYPLIEKGKNSQYMPLNQALGFYEKHFSNVYYTHGRDPEKDSKLAEFAQKGSVLLSTTVVEVGISLPRLSVMVIVAPERYGLATLHQLRGRLARTGLASWCFLLSKNDFAPRLEEFCATTDGFKIAEIDLKNRKSGDLSAQGEQSGEQFAYFDEADDEHIYDAARKRLIEVFGEFAL